MIRFFISIFLIVAMLSTSGFAHAAYNEITVLDTYNTFFHTDYSSTKAIAKDNLMVKPHKNWSLNEMAFLQVVAMDTSRMDPVYIRIDNEEPILIYEPTAWNGDSRGRYLTPLIDLAATYDITYDNQFSFFIGKQKITRNHARMFLSPTTDEFLIGFNDNGRWHAGDGDMNEPLLYGRTSATPIPGAVWLLGSGLIGLVGLRRRLS